MASDRSVALHNHADCRNLKSHTFDIEENCTCTLWILLWHTKHDWFEIGVALNSLVWSNALATLLQIQSHILSVTYRVHNESSVHRLRFAICVTTVSGLQLRYAHCPRQRQIRLLIASCLILICRWRWHNGTLNLIVHINMLSTRGLGRDTMQSIQTDCIIWTMRAVFVNWKNWYNVMILIPVKPDYSCAVHTM